MHSYGTCSTNYLIYLALFISPSTIRGSQFLFVNINFFFLTNVFFVCVFICFYWLLWFQSSLFFCVDVVWFLSVLVIFSWSYCYIFYILLYILYFLFQGELAIISDFSPCRFIGWILRLLSLLLSISPHNE